MCLVNQRLQGIGFAEHDSLGCQVQHSSERSVPVLAVSEIGMSGLSQIYSVDEQESQTASNLPEKLLQYRLGEKLKLVLDRRKHVQLVLIAIGDVGLKCKLEENERFETTISS